VTKRVEVLSLDRGASRLTVRAHGEAFDLAKHPQGTEVKAITYSNMQIHEKAGRADLYVIIDI
jgi:SHS2 domain-containing protein